MKILLQLVIMTAFLCGLVGLSYLLTRLLGQTLRRDWLFHLLLAPGTAIHELSHAFASLVLLVPVRKVHLFGLGREADGTARPGEVVHADGGPIRNFVIAMAPLFVAAGLIYGLSAWLLPKNESWGILLRSGWTYLFLVIVFFIALGLSPSRQDFKALPAFLAAAIVAVLAGYVVVIALSWKWSLSGAEKEVEAVLRTANAGLLFVLAMVAVTCGVFLIVHWLLRRRR